MKTCEFKIEGMTCDHCAVSIQNKLVENNGIYKSIARFEKSNAIVFFDFVNIIKYHKGIFINKLTSV